MSLLPEIEFLTVDKRSFVAEFAAPAPGAARASFRCAAAHAGEPARESLEHSRARARQGRFRPSRERASCSGCSPIGGSPRGAASMCSTVFGDSPRRSASRSVSSSGICRCRPKAVEYAARVIPDARPTLLISPCSSHAPRNWRAEYYAQVADHAVNRWGMRVVLCGGPSDIERAHGREHSRARRAPAGESNRPRHAAPDACAARRRHRAADSRFGTGSHGGDGRYAGHRTVRAHQSGSQRAVSQPAMVRGSIRRGGARSSEGASRKRCRGGPRSKGPGSWT